MLFDYYLSHIWSIFLLFTAWLFTLIQSILFDPLFKFDPFVNNSE